VTVTRRGLLKGLLGVTLAGLSLGAYAFGVEPGWRLRLQRWAVATPRWTAAPLRIAVIGDLHLGWPWVGLDRLAQVVALANAQAPDLAVLLGDYAAGHRFVRRPVPIAEAAPVLARLRARLGVRAILGNHDWWDDRAAQARGGGPNLYGQALEAAGIPVLSNRAEALEDFWLAGVEDQLALRVRGGFRGLDDLPGTLAQISDDRPVVLLAHEPDLFPQVPDRVALTLSGHTHGGQVRIAGWSPLVPSRFGNRYAYGHVREAGRDLVVTGGVGCSIAPVRFGVPPEVTLVTLTGAAG
jgi:hypothetical protein